MEYKRPKENERQAQIQNEFRKRWNRKRQYIKQSAQDHSNKADAKRPILNKGPFVNDLRFVAVYHQIKGG